MLSAQMPFGEVEALAWWTLRGFVPLEELVPLAVELSGVVGMILDGDPDIRSYRSDDHRGGKGGVGEQAYFAWVESWLIIGTWPERGKVRVVMSTCAIERFSAAAVTEYLVNRIGKVLVHDETIY